MSRILLTLLVGALLLSACTGTHAPAQSEINPPIENTSSPVQKPVDPEPKPETPARADGVSFIMPQPIKGELAEKLLDFVHAFSREYLFPEFADISQIDYEDPSVSSNLFFTARLERSDQLVPGVTIDEMNFVGRRFFGGDFEFPQGIGTDDIYGAYFDGVYQYQSHGRGGMSWWEYLLVNCDISEEVIVATFLPFCAQISWDDSSVYSVLFLYPYDMGRVRTGKDYFDAIESVAYLEDSIMPEYDGHILDYIFLVVPQEELGTITITFQIQDDGNLIAISSMYSR